MAADPDAWELHVEDETPVETILRLYRVWRRVGELTYPRCGVHRL